MRSAKFNTGSQDVGGNLTWQPKLQPTLNQPLSRPFVTDLNSIARADISRPNIQSWYWQFLLISFVIISSESFFALVLRILLYSISVYASVYYPWKKSRKLNLDGRTELLMRRIDIRLCREVIVVNLVKHACVGLVVNYNNLIKSRTCWFFYIVSSCVLSGLVTVFLWLLTLNWIPRWI